MSILIGEGASKPLCFAWFQQSSYGMHEDLASQRIDLPGLMRISAGSRGTCDVAGERPYRGIRSVSTNEGNTVSNKRTGSRHQSKGAPHACAEQAASGRINIGLPN